ncbi:MAG TPA: YkgJ family cysteine cluster protein [Pyrinomonadaceae bacterium]|nr:YkgJ family cysteine cluster protein [Pyrinomonadaceae bacterium]
METKDETMRSEVADGLLYAHSRANSNTAKLLEVSSFAYAAIELLAERGLIDIEDLDRKKKEIAGRLIEKFREEGIGAAYQEPEHDKYTFAGSVEIDCPSRLHLCKAACCRLRFALSHQDVEEGIVQWDFGHPYFIAQGDDGYCRHLDRNSLGCSIHGHRPVPCRGYDCRQDKRIWSDFERRIVSPELDKLFAAADGGDAPEAK